MVKHYLSVFLAYSIGIALILTSIFVIYPYNINGQQQEDPTQEDEPVEDQTDEDENDTEENDSTLRRAIVFILSLAADAPQALIDLVLSRDDPRERAAILEEYGETGIVPGEDDAPDRQLASGSGLIGEIDAEFDVEERYGLAITSEGANQLLVQLRQEPLYTWARDCLEYEVQLANQGMDIPTFLICSWRWFEGALDPYAVNCKDNSSQVLRQSVAFQCYNRITNPGDRNSLLQACGFQAFDRANANGYSRCYTACRYEEDDFQDILQASFENSAQSQNTYWRYTDQRTAGLVGQYYPELYSSDFNVSTDILADSASELSEDGRTQFYTLLAGKDPCMCTCLNQPAVATLPSDILTRGWAQYIRNNPTPLANRIEAMRLFYLEERERQQEFQLASSDAVSVDVGDERRARITNDAVVGNCPPNDQRILAPGITAEVRLDRRLDCTPPRGVAIHWVGSWGVDAFETANVLNNRRLSCQFMVDHENSLQGTNLYDDVIEKAFCVRGFANLINIEITGVSFDSVYNNRSSPYYERLIGDGSFGANGNSTGKALALTCWAVNKYDIPFNKVRGHFEFPDNADKSDPGEEYIDYFRERLENECRRINNRALLLNSFDRLHL